MASFQKRPSGWRAMIRMKGVSKSATFSTKAEAKSWALEIEGEIKAVHSKKRFSFLYPKHLISESEIVKQSIMAEATCGVYFLILYGRVIYVGKSVDVYCRISEHQSRGRKFSHFFIIPCPPDKLSVLETQYILSLSPEGNISKFGKLSISDSSAKLQDND